MDVISDILQEVSTSLINQQRTLANLREKLNTYPSAADILKPLIERVEEHCVFLGKSRDELRMATVVDRT